MAQVGIILFFFGFLGGVPLPPDIYIINQKESKVNEFFTKNKKFFLKTPLHFKFPCQNHKIGK